MPGDGDNGYHHYLIKNITTILLTNIDLTLVPTLERGNEEELCQERAPDTIGMSAFNKPTYIFLINSSLYFPISPPECDFFIFICYILKIWLF